MLTFLGSFVRNCLSVNKIFQWSYSVTFPSLASATIRTSILLHRAAIGFRATNCNQNKNFLANNVINATVTVVYYVYILIIFIPLYVMEHH